MKSLFSPVLGMTSVPLFLHKDELLKLNNVIKTQRLWLDELRNDVNKKHKITGITSKRHRTKENIAMTKMSKQNKDTICNVLTTFIYIN